MRISTWWRRAAARLTRKRLDDELRAEIRLYGLLAYSVTRRVPELGLRMALGASRGTVRWM